MPLKTPESNMAIWKFLLPINDEIRVEVPEFASMLSVGCQGDDLILWAMVVPSNPPTSYLLYIRGTGQPLTGREGRFLGTVQMPNGLVWHIFDSRL